MSSPLRSPLEGHPPTSRLRLAEPAPAASDRGAPKVVAEGVPAAVRPDQQTGDGRYPIAWLTITAPRGATPTATSICQCGRNLFAAGHHKALALIADHTDHKTRCPLRADQEGAAA
ncbi:hypothetical protein WQO_19145 [Streptomyces globisporus C-1027]|uniref:Uncharacterized protein n=1 Tax=Streptomyces globisporus C-1027 TaxID=1172567 RepID=A0A0U2SZT7_STRGL|nr:hypothetical protein [Streptomyces globisporus]ALU95248.1 hypothetical protein WQO_19145 [Streptomyces globisporus C-1027]